MTDRRLALAALLRDVREADRKTTSLAMQALYEESFRWSLRTVYR